MKLKSAKIGGATPFAGDCRKFCVLRKLLLEKILKSFARVVGTSSGWSCSGRGGSVVYRRSIFFDGHAQFKERAIVLGVFLRDAFWNGLGAFELPASIEVDALFAGVHLSMASGTLASRIESGHQDRAAAGASGPHHGSDHAGRSRAHHFLFWARLTLGTRVSV
jgi:hypothetical protein